MANIMEQGSQPDNLRVMCVNAQLPAKPSRNMEYSERVIEAGMERARIDQVGYGKLVNAAQPLEEGCVQHVQFSSLDGDEAVDWVADVALRTHTVSLMVLATVSGSNSGSDGEFNFSALKLKCDMANLGFGHL